MDEPHRGLNDYPRVRDGILRSSVYESPRLGNYTGARLHFDRIAPRHPPVKRRRTEVEKLFLKTRVKTEDLGSYEYGGTWFAIDRDGPNWLEGHRCRGVPEFFKVRFRELGGILVDEVPREKRRKITHVGEANFPNLAPRTARAQPRILTRPTGVLRPVDNAEADQGDAHMSESAETDNLTARMATASLTATSHDEEHDDGEEEEEPESGEQEYDHQEIDGDQHNGEDRDEEDSDEDEDNGDTIAVRHWKWEKDPWDAPNAPLSKKIFRTEAVPHHDDARARQNSALTVSDNAQTSSDNAGANSEALHIEESGNLQDRDRDTDTTGPSEHELMALNDRRTRSVVRLSDQQWQGEEDNDNETVTGHQPGDDSQLTDDVSEHQGLIYDVEGKPTSGWSKVQLPGLYDQTVCGIAGFVSHPEYKGPVSGEPRGLHLYRDSLLHRNRLEMQKLKCSEELIPRVEEQCKEDDNFGWGRVEHLMSRFANNQSADTEYDYGDAEPGEEGDGNVSGEEEDEIEPDEEEDEIEPGEGDNDSIEPGDEEEAIPLTDAEMDAVYGRTYDWGAATGFANAGRGSNSRSAGTEGVWDGSELGSNEGFAGYEGYTRRLG